MLRIETRAETTQEITYALAGQVGAEHLPELEALLDGARSQGRRVTLDLAGVLLVEREIVRFLASGAGAEAALANCPAYVLSWILCEGGHSPRSTA